MSGHRAHTVVLVALILGLGGWNGAHTQLPSVDAPRELETSLRAQVAQIDTVHLTARCLLSLVSVDGKLTKGEVKLEYWAQDDRYRIESSVDPVLIAAGVQGSRIITFDGVQSRLFMSDAGTLIVSSGAIPDSSAVPNPLFVPLGFLRIPSKTCQGCRTGLADLGGNPKWLDRPEGVRLSRAGHGTQPAEITIADGDGTTEIDFSQVSGSSFVGAQRKHSKAGRLIEVRKFTRPIVVQGTHPPLVVPAELVLDRLDGEGQLPGDAKSAKLEFVVDVLEINQPLDEAHFSIPDAIASTVINEDERAVTRAPQCTPTAPAER